MCKMVVHEDFYLKKEFDPSSQKEGARAMLNHLRNELGPEFFSADMRQTPEEKAAEDRRKYEELRCQTKLPAPGVTVVGQGCCLLGRGRENTAAAPKWSITIPEG